MSSTALDSPNRPARAWASATALAIWALLSVLTWRMAVLPHQPLAFHPFTMVDFRDSVWIPLDDFLRQGGIP